MRAVEELTRIKLYYGEKMNKLMVLLREANQGQERLRKEMEEQERYLKELHEERFEQLVAECEEKVRGGEQRCALQLETVKSEVAVANSEKSDKEQHN